MCVMNIMHVYTIYNYIYTINYEICYSSVLADKDNSPQWSPSSLAEVTEDIVEAHFAAPATGDLQL